MIFTLILLYNFLELTENKSRVIRLPTVQSFSSSPGYMFLNHKIFRWINNELITFCFGKSYKITPQRQPWTYFVHPKFRPGSESRAQLASTSTCSSSWRDQSYYWSLLLSRFFQFSSRCNVEIPHKSSIFKSAPPHPTSLSSLFSQFVVQLAGFKYPLSIDC